MKKFMKNYRFFRLFRGEIELISKALTIILCICENDNPEYEYVKKRFGYLFDELKNNSAVYGLLCLLCDKFFRVWNER